MVTLDNENPPLFTCHACFQGSHDCEKIKSYHNALSSVSSIAGFVWLCGDCLTSCNPIKPRKSKSRHTSVSKDVSTLSRLRQGMLGEEVTSPSNNSPGTFTPSDNPPALDLQQNLQSELQVKLQKLSKDRICPKYKSGQCPHGLRGNKEVNGQSCELDHPKRCFKFCRFGSKRKGGCSKGDSCEFYHPILCKFSVQKRCCTNKECTYVHLKGTRRDTDPPDNASKSQNNQVRKLTETVIDSKTAQPSHGPVF